jgi:prepilin-type N-terminal cleavage/methylation domain-containing protein
MGHNRKTCVPAGKAFTLVEVLVVVVILAIAGTIVIPHMLSSGTLGIQAAARMLIADILYAQNDAVAHQNARRIVFDLAANSYRLEDEAGNTLSVNWRTPGSGSGNYVMDFSTDSRFEGVRLSSVNFGGNADVQFDVLGSPSSGGSIEIEYKSSRYRVDVAPFTGRVTVANVTGG